MILFSCTDQKNETKNIKLKGFLDDFIKRNSNWHQNDVVNKQINDKFEKEMTNQISNGILDDFPLELSEINEYQKDSFATCFIAHYLKSDNIKPENILYKTNFDIIGLIPKEKVKELKNGNTYLVKGKFKNFLKQQDHTKYINGLIYTPLIGSFSPLEISMGVILMDITDLKEVPKL